MKLKFTKPPPRKPLPLPRTDLPTWDLPEPKPCPPDPLWKDIFATAFFSLTGGTVAAFVATAALARGLARTNGSLSPILWPAVIVGVIVAFAIAIYIWKEAGFSRTHADREYDYDEDYFDDRPLR